MYKGTTQIKNEAEEQSERLQLEQTIKSYLNDQNDKISFAVHLVCKYDMRGSIPMVRTCEKLV